MTSYSRSDPSGRRSSRTPAPRTAPTWDSDEPTSTLQRAQAPWASSSAQQPLPNRRQSPAPFAPAPVASSSARRLTLPSDVIGTIFDATFEDSAASAVHLFESLDKEQHFDLKDNGNFALYIHTLQRCTNPPHFNRILHAFKAGKSFIQSDRLALQVLDEAIKTISFSEDPPHRLNFILDCFRDTPYEEYILLKLAQTKPDETARELSKFLAQITGKSNEEEVVCTLISKQSWEHQSFHSFDKYMTHIKNKPYEDEACVAILQSLPDVSDLRDRIYICIESPNIFAKIRQRAQAMGGDSEFRILKAHIEQLPRLLGPRPNDPFGAAAAAWNAAALPVQFQAIREQLRGKPFEDELRFLI